MKARWAIGLLLVSGAEVARADVGPPPRNDCSRLAPGAPCWAEGRRAGACVEAFDGGAVVCAAGVSPTRAVASSKPAAPVPPAPSPAAQSGCSLVTPERESTPGWLIGLAAALLLRARRR